MWTSRRHRWRRCSRPAPGADPARVRLHGVEIFELPLPARRTWPDRPRRARVRPRPHHRAAILYRCSSSPPPRCGNRPSGVCAGRAGPATRRLVRRNGLSAGHRTTRTPACAHWHVSPGRSAGPGPAATGGYWIGAWPWRNSRTLIGGSGTPLGEIPRTTVRMRLPAGVGSNPVADPSLWAGAGRKPSPATSPPPTPQHARRREPGNQHGEPQLIVGFALEGG